MPLDRDINITEARTSKTSQVIRDIFAQPSDLDRVVELRD